MLPVMKTRIIRWIDGLMQISYYILAFSHEHDIGIIESKRLSHHILFNDG